MRIAFEMHDDVCVFAHPPGYDEAVDELDLILERRNFGALSELHYRRALEELVSRRPWFVDGHAHLGNRLYHEGRFEQALDTYTRGLSLCMEVLPSGSQASIEWSHLKNRPFLRAARGLSILGRIAFVTRTTVNTAVDITIPAPALSAIIALADVDISEVVLSTIRWSSCNSNDPKDQAGSAAHPRRLHARKHQSVRKSPVQPIPFPFFSFSFLSAPCIALRSTLPIVTLIAPAVVLVILPSDVKVVVHDGRFQMRTHAADKTPKSERRRRKIREHALGYRNAALLPANLKRNSVGLCNNVLIFAGHKLQAFREPH